MAQAALFVVAHPDDETMFFSPTILSLIENGLRVALLCLSTGNADGLGPVRAQELMRACSLLGIARGDVMLVDDPRLQDGMHQHWQPAAVAEQVARAVQQFQPHRVYTFDAGGISGHPNHAATCAGVLHWRDAVPSSSSSSSLSSLPQVWHLQTVCLPRKYLALLDAPLSCLLSCLPLCWRQQSGVHLNLRPWRAWRALLAHHSQMVWYRRLWMLLSSYMYVNTLAQCI